MGVLAVSGEKKHRCPLRIKALNKHYQDLGKENKKRNIIKGRV